MKKTLIDEMLDMEEFHAKHIAVVDSKSGRLLLGKKAYQMAYPASTTKIATCIYAIEQGELDQEVVMPRTTQTGSIAGISTGELVCMRDLLYGLMLISGNDIAEALAIHICGTIEKFMNELNKFINRIGLKNTVFINPHGIHDSSHYTTAYDMALLTRYALKNSIFREIVSTSVYKCKSSRREYIFENTNALIHQKKNYNDRRYPFCIGVKTGQTSMGGYCLVSAALKNRKEIIVVQLTSLDDYGTDLGWSYRFTEAIELFEWTFVHYKELISKSFWDSFLIHRKNTLLSKNNKTLATNFNLYEKEAPHYSEIKRNEKEYKSRFYIKRNGSIRHNISRQPITDIQTTAHIMCVGDLLCEGGMYNAGNYDGHYNFHSCFRYVKDLFKEVDWVIGNLETMICTEAPYTGERYKINNKYHCNAPTEFLEALHYAGFDTFALSNNHNCDCGVKGIFETLDHLDRFGFSHTGLFYPESKKRVLLAEINGIHIALLSYSTWFNRNETRFTKKGQDEILNIFSEDKLVNDIRMARREGAEYIIVYMHWGIDAEYRHTESASQRELAQKVAEAGVDYIIGSHTHAVQRYDILITKDKRKVPVIYSIGNFATSEQATISRDTIILSLKLGKREGKVQLLDDYYIPCHIFTYYKGESYPIIPAISELCKEAVNEPILQKAHTTLLKVTGKLLRCFGQNNKSQLTLSFIYRALSLNIPKDFKDHEFTSINFAMDTRNNGVAVILPISSDPQIYQSKIDSKKLADVAIQKGAALLLAQEQIGEYPCLIVPNAFEAYNKICADIRSQYSPRTIGITGSIGKTTTTEMIFSIVSSKWNTHRSTGSANNVRYASNVVQQLEPKHEAYVQEIMEGPPYGAASTISKIVQPQISVVTVVGTSHFEAFGTQQRIAESCVGIQDGMPDDGIMILNADDSMQGQIKTRIPSVTYGVENTLADFYATDIKITKAGMTFKVIYDTGKADLQINCYGKHNVSNAVAAFAVGYHLGMTDDEIKKGISQYRTSGIRQNLYPVGGYTLFLDCYNSAPESIETAFKTFADIPLIKGGKRIAVVGDMLELGTDTVELHQKSGKFISSTNTDLLIGYGKDSSYLIDEVKGHLPVLHTTNPNDLLEILKNNITENDIVLFKGSHGMQLELIVDRWLGTWLHEEFERYDFISRNYAEGEMEATLYTDHAVINKWKGGGTSFSVPDTVNSLPLTGIGQSAFSHKELKEIQFSDQIRNVRYCAFYKCDNLTVVDLPKSLQILDRSAFSTCANLREVYMQHGVIEIGYRAFGNCRNLEKVIIPASVNRIGDEAFVNCKKLSICGTPGSYAEEYANKHQISFLALR